jgi:hypothetical protein
VWDSSVSVFEHAVVGLLPLLLVPVCEYFLGDLHGGTVRVLGARRAIIFSDDHIHHTRREGDLFWRALLFWHQKIGQVEVVPVLAHLQGRYVGVHTCDMPKGN